MVQRACAGLLPGILYLWCSRTLAVPIVAHGVCNTLVFVLIYLDRYPGV
jgi:membrane protease YdiL (CAAX protease family)